MDSGWQRFLTEANLEPDRLSDVSRPDVAPYCAALTTLAVLELKGPDANSFMQGYFTADLDQLTEDHALFGAYCDIKGRVVADLLLIATDDGVLMATQQSLVPAVEDSLSKYLLFSRSKLSDASATWLALGLIGADADGEPNNAPPWTVSACPGRYQIAVPKDTGRWLCIASPTAAAEVWPRFAAAGDPLPWRQADIEAGIAHLDLATSASYLPQMLGYEELDAISFDKGCYLGQEVVTRAQHRGRVKRQLGRWQAPEKSDLDLLPGVDLAGDDGRRAGTVIQSAGHFVMAVVTSEHIGQTLYHDGLRLNPA